MVQDTLVAVSKHIQTFKYDPQLGSFKTWLYTITRSRITDQFRKRGPVRVENNDPTLGTRAIEQLPDPNIKLPEDAWEHQWNANLESVAKANVRQSVDPQHYQIYDFVEHKNWAVERVAATFDVSKEQIYVIKCRVKKRISDEVARLNREVF